MLRNTAHPSLSRAISARHTCTLPEYAQLSFLPSKLLGRHTCKLTDIVEALAVITIGRRLS